MPTWPGEWNWAMAMETKVYHVPGNDNHTHGLHNTAHTKQQPYTYNTHVQLHHNKCFTCRGYRSSQSSHISHKYATLMSPNKGDTAVCGSSIFCLLDDWGDDHWLPQIGLRSTWPWFSFCWPGQVGVKPSDYYHLPLIPKHWHRVQIIHLANEHINEHAMMQDIPANALDGQWTRPLPWCMTRKT